MIFMDSQCQARKQSLRAREVSQRFKDCWDALFPLIGCYVDGEQGELVIETLWNDTRFAILEICRRMCVQQEG